MSKTLNIIIENTFSPSKEVCENSLTEIRNEHPDRKWTIKPAVWISEVKREMKDGYCVFEVVVD